MAYFAFTVIFVVALAILIHWLIRHIRIRRLLNKIQGPRALPLIGNVHQLRSDPDDFWDQLTGVCLMFPTRPNMMRFWLMWAPFLLVYGAEEAEVFLSSNKCINKSHEYDLLHPWMGLGLLTSDDKKWRPRRKLLTPTFHYDILKDFMYAFNEQARILVKKLEKVAGTGPFDVCQYITLCALDIICQSSMGRHVNAQLHKDSEYVKAIYDLNNIIHDRQKKPWFWSNFLFDLFGEGKNQKRCLDIVHGFANKVINERYQELFSNSDVSTYDEGKKRLAFLDLLLEMVKKGTLNLQDVQDETNTFMFEGHDTTSAGMNWTLQLVGGHPEVQAKIHEELDRVFGLDNDRDVHYEDLKNLPYLEMCIKEALRLYPSVPVFGRVITEDTKYQDFVIPESTQLLFVPYAVHRDPRHWPDPEMFDPDRFLPKNSVNRHAFAYLPFSAGARNCIGQRFALMEEKTVLAWIFRYFNVKSCLRRDQIRPKAELILRPSQGISMEFTLRRRALQE